MNIFLERPKNQISAFCMSADSFHNILLSFCGENLKKNLLASGFKITSSRNLLRLVTLKVVQKAACYSENDY
jgi:hypothetical protein